MRKTQPSTGQTQAPQRVVLAYSGGLVTSIILKWLQDEYHCEEVTFTADIGQGEEIEPARAKAIKFGIKPEQIFIDDLREEFVRDFVFPMFRCKEEVVRIHRFVVVVVVAAAADPFQ